MPGRQLGTYFLIELFCLSCLSDPLSAIFTRIVSIRKVQLLGCIIALLGIGLCGIATEQWHVVVLFGVVAGKPAYMDGYPLIMYISDQINCNTNSFIAAWRHMDRLTRTLITLIPLANFLGLKH